MATLAKGRQALPDTGKLLLGQISLLFRKISRSKNSKPHTFPMV